MKKLQEKCLLVQTKDGRKFLTRRKNVPQLTEFAKTFDAQLFFAEADPSQILDLAELPGVLCDAMYKNPTGFTAYEAVPEKQQRRSRSEMNEIGKEITEYIRDQFLAGEIVSLKGITQKFAVHNLSQPYLSNRLAVVRLMMYNQGIPIRRLGPGKYQQLFIRSADFLKPIGEMFKVSWGS